MTKKLKPLNNFIAVERIEEEAVTKGGIIIPETSKQKLPEAIVIAVSDKVKTLNEGDKVLLSKWAGVEIKFDGKELLMIKEDDVLAVV